ncbi:hypothetical protein ACIA5E_21375 [Nocardia asteroides]|uniref:hypothetical protein n=1 Tax=Nocardia asteroides TaxID=1824 RepID=UPI0037B782A7
MKKSVAALALTAAALITPTGVAAAAPAIPVAPVADSGSAAAEAVCRLLKMLQAGYVDSSGSLPSCLASSGSA